MTFLLILGLIAWLSLGCAIAWVIGRASDLGCPLESRFGATPTRVPQSPVDEVVVGEWSDLAELGHSNPN